MVKRIVTFKIDERLLEKLDIFCKSHGVTRSHVIRLLIECYIDSDIDSCNQLSVIRGDESYKLIPRGRVEVIRINGGV